MDGNGSSPKIGWRDVPDVLRTTAKHLAEESGRAKEDADERRMVVLAEEMRDVATRLDDLKERFPKVLPTKTRRRTRRTTRKTEPKTRRTTRKTEPKTRRTTRKAR